MAALALLFIGIGAGGVLAAQRPSFWAGLAVVMFKAALPIISKRMTPEQEADFQKAARRGAEWNPFRKRARNR